MPWVIVTGLAPVSHFTHTRSLCQGEVRIFMDERSLAEDGSAVGERTFQTFTMGRRCFLAAACAGAAAIFFFIATALGWPVFYKHEASVLFSAAPGRGVATVVIGMLICLPLATLAAGWLRY